MKRGFAVVVAAILPRAALALDPFEIQVYDGTANKPGELGFELHLNHVATGYGSADPPELPLQGQTHATLEPSFGLYPWWELGGYLQSALVPDNEVRFAGVKLRSKFVAPEGFRPGLRLGVNLELSYLPAAFERDSWGGEVRPIVGYAGAGWLAIANPIIGLSFSGASGRAGPTFEPAVKLARTFAETLAVGAEYYASIGPMASPEPLRSEVHQLFGVLDVEAFSDVEIELGLGGGLTPASAGLIGKVILGYTFEVVKR